MIENDDSLERGILTKIDFKQLYKAEVENFSSPDEGMARGDCPFCQDGRKLFYITNEGNFSCFKCGAKGSFIDFFKRRHQVDYEGALKVLTAYINTEPSEDNQDNHELIEPDEKETDTVEQPGREQDPSGFYFERGLYHSPAFISLGKNSVKVLIAFLNVADGNGSGDLSIPYHALEEIYKIPRSGIPKAIGELQEKGFLKLVHQGGSGKGDRNLYSLSGDYKNWVSEKKVAQREEIESVNENLTNQTNFEQDSKSKPFGEKVGMHFHTLKTALGIN